VTNPQITTDLATILERIENKIDKQSEQVNERFNRIEERLQKLEIGQAKIEEKLVSLEDKIKIQDKRLDSIEFVNRGIFVSLTLAVLGGFAKIFGFIGNSP
jgi:predicted nuclease with TOPRIM domain